MNFNISVIKANVYKFRSYYTQISKRGAKKVTREITASENDSGKTLVDFLQGILRVKKKIVLDKIYAREVKLINRKVSQLRTSSILGGPRTSIWQNPASERLPFRTAVKAGDIYHVDWIEPLWSAPKVEQLKELAAILQKQIVYKDEDAVILNKPSALVHGNSLKTSLTLESCLPYLLPENKEPLKMVHLIDKDCSGIVVLARSEEATHRLGRIFSGGRTDKVEKTYSAIVYVNNLSVFKSKIRPAVEAEKWMHVENTLALTYNPKTNRKQMCVVQAQTSDTLETDELNYVRHASSLWRPIEVFEPAGERRNWLVHVQLKPQTARKHQLRLHCSQVLECPILGDYRYGFRDRHVMSLFPDATHVPLFLHHEQLKIHDYFGSGKHLEVAAPLPSKFEDLFKGLQKEKEDEKSFSV